MNPAWTVAYAAAFVLILALALWNLATYRRLKAKSGDLQVRWSCFFHLGFIENILILSLALAVGVWSFALVFRDPGSQDGYRRLLLLAFGLALSPRRSVVVGSRGIVYRLRFIPWSSIRTRAYWPKGSRVMLRLLFETTAGSNRFQTMTIPLPRRIHLSRPANLT